MCKLAPAMCKSVVFSSFLLWTSSLSAIEFFLETELSGDSQTGLDGWCGNLGCVGQVVFGILTETLHMTTRKIYLVPLSSQI